MVLGLNFLRYSRDPIAYIKTSYGTLEVHDTRIIIGREERNDIVLSDLWVSRRHGTITFDIAHFTFLYEDHSLNGTYINNQFVHNKIIHLPNLADIIIGAGSQVTKMRFESSFAALIDSDKKMHVIPISKEFLLGREGLHQVPAHYGHVSRQHAVIRYDARMRHYVLIDNSTNGTYIGQRRIHHNQHLLKDNDRIILAGEYQYIYRHFLPEPVHHVRPQIVEPPRIGEVEWQKIIEGGYGGGIWAKFGVNRNFTSWKFHIFAEEVDGLFNIGRILIPALSKENILFKTVKKIEYLEMLHGPQNGKAFTVYICSPNPSDIRNVRITANQYFQFIHSLLLRPEILTRHKHIEGDRQVPGDKTGRIFYRYQGLRPGPGSEEQMGYRENKFGNAHNIPNNPDIF